MWVCVCMNAHTKPCVRKGGGGVETADTLTNGIGRESQSATFNNCKQTQKAHTESTHTHTKQKGKRSAHCTPTDSQKGSWRWGAAWWWAWLSWTISWCGSLCQLSFHPPQAATPPQQQPSGPNGMEAHPGFEGFISARLCIQWLQILLLKILHSWVSRSTTHDWFAAPPQNSPIITYAYINLSYCNAKIFLLLKFHMKWTLNCCFSLQIPPGQKFTLWLKRFFVLFWHSVVKCSWLFNYSSEFLWVILFSL